MKRSLPSLIIGGILTIILLAYMVFYQVSEDELAVVRTFGRVEPPNASGVSPDVKTEPGWYLRAPWPIQDVDIYDTRYRLSETVGLEANTSDAKNVVLRAAVMWQLKEPFKYVTSSQDEADAKEKLLLLVRDQLQTTLGQYAFEELVSNREQLKYDEITDKLQTSVAAKALDLYGIEVRRIGLETLTLPSDNTEDVFEAMKKERQATAALYTSEGESKAEAIRAQADSIAGTITYFAERRAAEIVTEGRERAASYSSVFAQDPGLAVFLRQVENLANMLKDRTTVILRTKDDPWYLLESIERPGDTDDSDEPGEAETASGEDSVEEEVKIAVESAFPKLTEAE